MMVVTLSNFLNLNPMEAKALNIIMRLEKRKEMKKEAAYVLTGSAKYRFSIRKNCDSHHPSNRLIIDSVKNHM